MGMYHEALNRLFGGFVEPIPVTKLQGEEGFPSDVPSNVIDITTIQTRIKGHPVTLEALRTETAGLDGGLFTVRERGTRYDGVIVSQNGIVFHSVPVPYREDIIAIPTLFRNAEEALKAGRKQARRSTFMRGTGQRPIQLP